mmetsp:Transcript_5766/g.5227  ORF Transcript_5766/g.5227 Transcript_5766/m.5227 type:complete len:166 (-) Transcript_5766:1805-2302(-)
MIVSPVTLDHLSLFLKEPVLLPKFLFSFSQFLPSLFNLNLLVLDFSHRSFSEFLLKLHLLLHYSVPQALTFVFFLLFIHFPQLLLPSPLLTFTLQLPLFYPIQLFYVPFLPFELAFQLFLLKFQFLSRVSHLLKLRVVVLFLLEEVFSEPFQPSLVLFELLLFQR